MTTRTDRIQTAIAHLSATELADGDYAYLDEATGNWYRLSPFDLENLGDVLAEDPDATYDSYSEWADMSGGDPMLPPDFEVNSADVYEEDANTSGWAVTVAIQSTHGEILVEAGVHASDRGTAEAMGHARGMGRVWAEGDIDGWCPDALRDVPADLIIEAVRKHALRVWRQS